jgi:hypothetical protein
MEACDYIEGRMAEVVAPDKEMVRTVPFTLSCLRLIVVKADTLFTYSASQKFGHTYSFKGVSLFVLFYYFYYIKTMK